MLQREVPERLEDHRPRLSDLQLVLVADVDHPVAGVGDRAARAGEAGDTLDAEAVAAHQLGEDALADRAEPGYPARASPSAAIFSMSTK